TNLLGSTTVTEIFPSGWQVVDSTGGAVSGNNITFTFGADGQASYRLRSPNTCANVIINGVTSGQLCRGEVVSEVRRLRCGIQFSGGISGMLMLGPIDLGNAGA